MRNEKVDFKKFYEKYKDLINEQSLFSPPPPESRPPNRHPKH